MDGSPGPITLPLTMMVGVESMWSTVVAFSTRSAMAFSAAGSETHFSNSASFIPADWATFRSGPRMLLVANISCWPRKAASTTPMYLAGPAQRARAKAAAAYCSGEVRNSRNSYRTRPESMYFFLNAG